MNGSFPKLCRRVVLTALVAVVAGAAAAIAYFASTGTGNASATVGRLTGSTITTATAGAGTVTLGWSAVTPPAGSGTMTYYVSRDGASPGGNCPTSASPSSVTSCTDNGVAAGSHNYTVTAVWQTWTATSAIKSVTLTSGALAKLVFTTQPDGLATGGLAFPQQPVVTAEDSAGNTVQSYTGSVSVSIKSGTTGASLSGCSSSRSSGVTSFSGCKIDKAGTYVLTASDATLSSDSASFSVSVGPAAQLAFTQQPDGSATGGLAFPTQPKVAVEDAGGNIVATDSSTVSLSITSGTGTSGAALSGCSGSVTGGVTAFSGCKIDQNGSNYKLHASDGTLTPTDSNPFNVSVGPAAQLTFTQQPDGSATGGLAFPTQPKVAVEDAGGNIVATDSSTVKLAITTGTPTSGGPGTVSGCTGTETSGVVSFSGCSINTAGTNYKLHATDGTLTPTDSNPFNVAVGPAAQLAFTQQPDGAPTAGQPFPQQPDVAVEDAGGNIVTTDTSTVSLSITSGTGTSGASLSGCSGSVSGGVTSFSGCAISVAGSGYELHATDQSLAGTDSAPFNVTNVAATSVAEVAGPAASLSTTSISPVNGSAYLVFVYCYGQSASCNGTSAEANVTSAAFSSVSFVESEGAGSSTSKNCLEVFTATGTTTTGAVTVTGVSGQSIGFVNIVRLSPGAKVQNATSLGASSGKSSPATAALNNPPSTYGELVPVAIDDGNGQTSISLQTPTSGMNLLGTAQQSGAVGADLSVYFDSTAQTSASFALNPTNPLNGWATFALEVG